jgi:miniconductance mechanosensitive channel
VRLLPVSDNGVPLEFYLFSLLPDFDSFENFQSLLIEYTLALLPDFGLKVYQRPAAQPSEMVKNV